MCTHSYNLANKQATVVFLFMFVPLLIEMDTQQTPGVGALMALTG